MFGYKVVPKYVQTQLATARVTGTCSIAANSSDPASINLVGNPSITADTIVTPGAITGHLTN